MSADRHKHGQDHFDLLPFIAILMCVLACLLLVTMSITALSIGDVGSREGWVPSVASVRGAKQPVLIEWDGTAAIIHENGRKRSVAWSAKREFTILNGQIVSQSQSSTDDVMSEFLADMKARKDTAYALIAVRPSGFKTLLEFADEFRDRGIAVGYEPIAQSKTVRLLPGGQL